MDDAGSNSASAVLEALDPVLTRRGFAAGQAGEDDETAQIIWCAAYDEFRLLYPRLPQAHDQDEHADSACVDLVIDLAAGRLVRTDLENLSLAETFDAIDRPHQRGAAAAVIGGPAQSGARDLGPLLEILFDESG